MVSPGQIAYRKLQSSLDNMKFIIEEDLPDVGWYLHIFRDNKQIADYLQNTMEAVKSQAFEEYGVPLDSWDEYS